MPDKKSWVLVSGSGRDLGGHFTGSPGAAAKKAASSDYAKPKLPRDKAGSVVVYLRQTSTGRGHNQFKCYRVDQRMVKPPPNAPEWLRAKPKVPQKTSKEMMCPARLRNIN